MPAMTSAANQDLRKLLAELDRFLGTAANHFEQSGMPGWAGNCSIKRKAIKAALKART